MSDTLRNTDEPLDGVLGQATSALRDAKVPAGPPPEVDEATVNELRGRVYRPWTTRLKGRIYTMSGAIKLAAAAAVALAAGLSIWLGLQAQPARADQILSGAMRAMANLQTVHIQSRMRTIPGDNFQVIGLGYKFVPIEMWKDFRPPARWRVTNQGRVAVMDGQSAVTLCGGEYAYRDARTGFVGSLMDVDRVLEAELRQAREEGSRLSVRETVAADGVRELELTVDAKAKGGANDWLKNKYIDMSDNRRVYRFAADGLFLRSLQIRVHADGGDVLVFETTSIEYNVPIDPALFTLQLPPNVIWSVEPQVLADNGKYVKMGPYAAARAFFEACGREDWDEVLKFESRTDVSPRLKEYLGGLQIIRLGKPFKSAGYAGWFVPYEIRFKSGRVQAHNLAVRNDNPAKRYIVDGGI